MVNTPTFEGTIPSPTLRVRPGNRLEIEIPNNLVLIKIPDDHPSGTFWYHPHKHSAVTYQMFGGMAGFLIVEGGPRTLDAVPEVKAARDVVMDSR